MKSAYKLFTLRKNGTIGPLFINRQQIIPIGKWLKAECHPTKGFAVRAGWHCSHAPIAPHLSKKGRVWCKVSIKKIKEYVRPKTQGGIWYTAGWMRVDNLMDMYEASEKTRRKTWNDTESDAQELLWKKRTKVI